jgi:UrcA family protein
MKTLLQITALLAATCVAGTAVCQPQAPEPGAPGRHGPVKVLVIVNAHGLDLSSAAGADRFVSRLDAAVNRACNDRPTIGAFTLFRSDEFQACRAKALETAMVYVRSPLVRQRYAQMRAGDQLRLARR